MLLQKRSNGVYYFRWVCPPAIRQLLGKREIIKSLRTTSKFHALARAGAYYLAIQGIKDVQSRYDRGLITRDTYDGEMYECYMAFVSDVIKKRFEEHLPVDLMELEQQREATKKSLKMISDSRLNSRSEVAAGYSIQDRIWDHINSHDELAMFKAVGDAIKCHPDLLSRFKDDMVHLYHWILIELDKKINTPDVLPAMPSYMCWDKKSDDLPVSKALRLSELFEEFLTHKVGAGLRTSDQTEYKSYIPAVLFFIGDIHIDCITKSHVRECLTKYLTLPVRNKNPYRGKSIEELVAMDVPKIDRVKNKTMEQVRRMLQGMFRYAIDQGYINLSPAIDLNLKLEKERGRAAFNRTQVVNLLSRADTLANKNEWKKWVLLLGAYTGARSGEITQIRGEDIKRDDDSGIFYILITPEAGPNKTSSSYRTIPIHSKLLELGFLSYVGSKEGRIFPSNAKSSAVSKWFPTYRDKANVPSKTDFNESLVFHSFRHSLVTFARAAGASDVQVQQIVGHEKTGAGITDNYTHRIPVSDLKPIIELIHYL